MENMSSQASGECCNDSTVDAPASDGIYPHWLSILLLPFGIVGFLSNILVCVTILKAKSLHDVTHYLILNLAVSDGLCCLMFSLEMFMLSLGYPNAQTNDVAQALHCHLIFSSYLFQSFAYVSAYNLVVISLERYVSIVSPLKYIQVCTGGKIRLAIFLAWVLGFCIYLIHLIGVQYERSGIKYIERCQIWYHDWHWHFLPFVAGFAAPLVTMIWAYTRIIKALKESTHSRDFSAQAKESRQAKKRVVHLMLIVTITYAVLYIPTQPIYMIINTIDNGSFELALLLTDLLSKLPVLLNSIANPFIYAFKYKKFRKGLRNILCPCVRITVLPNGDGDKSFLTLSNMLRNRDTRNSDHSLGNIEARAIYH